MTINFSLQMPYEHIKKGMRFRMQKNLTTLEFNKVKDILLKYCCTYIGEQKVNDLIPSNDSDIVKRDLNQTFCALNLLFRKGSPEISNITDVEIWVKNLESYNTLSAKALLDVANVLKTARLLHEYFYDDSIDLADFSALSDLFSMLYYNKSTEDLIFKSIIDEDTIADDASKTLATLRRNKRNLEQGLRDKLSNFIHSSNSKYLMDSIITIRNDRFVIPVKAEYKDAISGAILDISASGSTVYIEPSSVFELNNKINSIKAEENIEIEKILKNLSLKLFPIASNIRASLETIGTLDFIFAKAKYSRKIQGILPNINTEPKVNLIGARHPLIDENKVVPIDISIGFDYKTLLITGPNTGGKTVTLKTIGLLSLMACSGILIPAKEGSSIYVFDSIFADIGDEQSIQESLSTFSSHMVNVIDILNKATSESLVLVDELGSGTDPIEGASLAISVLEELHNLKCLTICTTHYHELKEYALTHTGFENASSDFDVEDLRPTYKLLIGVPGKSNAFAISKKLGLPAKVLERAKSFVNESDANIEELLKNIYDDKLQIEKEKERYTQNANQVEALRKSLEKSNSKKEQEALEIIEKAKIKARDILLDAKDEANYIIKELNNESIDSKEANNLRNKLNTSIKDLSKQENSNKNLAFQKLTAEDLYIGQTLKILKLNLEGTVLTLPNRTGNFKMQVGSMEMTMNINDGFEIISKNNTSKKASKISYENNKAKNVATEINVIGLTVDESLPLIDKYLDDCYMAKLEQARIVHGKGTGRLRDGIHSFLRKNPRVKNFRLGTFGEGEMGVTIVYFK